MRFPRPVVLCADDFGLSDGVSQGILELAALGRISATGVMSNMPGWRRNAPALRVYRDRIGTGLHLNLTTGKPLGAMPALAPNGAFPQLGPLLRQAFSGRLPAPEVRDEIDRQLAAFEDALGAPPDFVDGHQHVHVLPGIRQELIEALKAKGYGPHLWLRDPSDTLLSILDRRMATRKAIVVRSLAVGFGKLVRAAGYGVNEGFSGFSPLEPQTDAPTVLRRAFRGLGPSPVVMCHPGHVDEELRSLDPILESRAAELAFLSSDAFLHLCEEKHLVLVPMPERAGRDAYGAPKSPVA